MTQSLGYMILAQVMLTHATILRIDHDIIGMSLCYIVAALAFILSFIIDRKEGGAK